MLKIAVILLYLVSAASLGNAAEPTFFTSSSELEEELVRVRKEIRPEDRPVIWYIPHPDDESIGMAGALQIAQKEGRENIVVFLTRGGFTFARYFRSLSIDKVKEFRVKEAMAALRVLEIPPDRVFFAEKNSRFLELEWAKEIIKASSRVFPDASHRTTSIHDPAPDHQTAARALLATREKSDRDLDVVFYRVYHYFNRQVVGRYPVEKFAVPDQKKKQKALRAYASKDVEDGLYAIGYSSTADLINLAKEVPYEYRDERAPLPDRYKLLYMKLGTSRDPSAGFEAGRLDSSWRIALLGSYHRGLEVRTKRQIIQHPLWGDLYIGAGAYSEDEWTFYSRLGLTIGNLLFFEKQWTGAHSNFIGGFRFYIF